MKFGFKYLMYIISKVIKKIIIPSIKNSEVHKTSAICSGTQIVDSKVSKYSYVGNNSNIIHTSIGAFTSIADNCVIGGLSHPITWVSTSPVFHHGKNILKKNFSNNRYDSIKKTIIGNDVWIGSNTIIKGGVEIGNGSIIGMGSVLTKNVNNHEIWAGNPAKFIRKRFSEDIIDKIENSKWWDWSDETLYEKAECFNDIEEFLGYCSEESED